MPEQMIKYAVALQTVPRYLASFLSWHASQTSSTRRSASPSLATSLSTLNRPEISPAYFDLKHKTDTNRGVSLLTHWGRFEATESEADVVVAAHDWSAASNAIAKPLCSVNLCVIEVVGNWFEYSCKWLFVDFGAHFIASLMIPWHLSAKSFKRLYSKINHIYDGNLVLKKSYFVLRLWIIDFIRNYLSSWQTVHQLKSVGCWCHR